jgi:hypothetical protein
MSISYAEMMHVTRFFHFALSCARAWMWSWSIVIYEVLGHFVEVYMKLMDDGGFGYKFRPVWTDPKYRYLLNYDIDQ